MRDGRRGPTVPGRRQRARLAVALAAVVASLATAACGLPFLPGASGLPTPAVPAGVGAPSDRQLFGVFLGSDEVGVERMSEFEQFLGGGVRLRVGHTYLDGSDWAGLERPDNILDPWSAWKKANPEDLFVLNVPMATPNEGQRGGPPPLDDGQVAALLKQGAAGEFDRYFAALAKKLVDKDLQDAVLIPGWEMNGITYSHRCGPDPESWKTYFRRVVSVMRSQAGQRFVFDFNPSRGTDDISWAKCYPGDDVVDIIGMDTYDQEPGQSWQDYVSQPDGMQAQVDFAAARGKPVSYPEWGLSRNGDNPEFIRDMHGWITEQDTIYSTFTDYCPHGVMTCTSNPRSAEVFKQLFGR